MDTRPGRILIVDDEPDILDFLGYNLKKEGYEVFTANNGREGVQMALSLRPHLVLLDVMMPGMDGIEACQEMRKSSTLKDSVIAFLTARSEDYSQIAGFDAGADDYIAKPIKPRVLISRIRALLRRVPGEGDLPEVDARGTLRRGPCTISREKYSVSMAGTEIPLPKKEFELLYLLASKQEKVFTREEIYSAVWGDDVVVGDRTIDVHIRKLREKLGDMSIRTIKGVGYKFELE